MIKYRRPPLVERALGIFASIDEETFQRKLPIWAEKVAQDFPVKETVPEWVLALTQKDGMPVLSDKGHKVTLRQVFWQLVKGKKTKGIQLWPDRISFNLLDQADFSHDYDELHQMVERWLLIWAEEFEVKEIRGIALEYVNVLSSQTLKPQFATEHDIRLANILAIYGNIPDKVLPTSPSARIKLVLPYDFQMGIKAIDDTDPANSSPLQFRVKLVSEPRQPGALLTLKLTLSATTIEPNRRISVQQGIKEFASAHECLIRGFEALFTAEARASFEPYDTDIANPSRE